MPDAVNPRLIVQLCEVTQGSPSSADKEWAPVGRLPNREMRVTAGISNPQHLEEPQESEDKGMRIRNHSINILIMGESLRKITLVVMPSVGVLRILFVLVHVAACTGIYRRRNHDDERL